MAREHSPASSISLTWHEAEMLLCALTTYEGHTSDYDEDMLYDISERLGNVQTRIQGRHR